MKDIKKECRVKNINDLIKQKVCEWDSCVTRMNITEHQDGQRLTSKKKKNLVPTVEAPEGYFGRIDLRTC